MTYRLSDEDREALAEAAYRRKVAWSRTAITPWTGLAPFQRQQQQDRAVESTVEAIVAREVAAALAPVALLASRAEAAESKVAAVEALAGEWWNRATEATSEPLSWRRVTRDLRAAMGGRFV